MIAVTSVGSSCPATLFFTAATTASVVEIMRSTRQPSSKLVATSCRELVSNPCARASQSQLALTSRSSMRRAETLTERTISYVVYEPNYVPGVKKYAHVKNMKAAKALCRKYGVGAQVDRHYYQRNRKGCAVSRSHYRDVWIYHGEHPKRSKLPSWVKKVNT